MERLKELRKNRGLTQADMATHLKVNRTTLTKYETGEREPDFSTLLSLASFFDVSTDYLLGRTNLRSPMKVSGNKKEPLMRLSNCRGGNVFMNDFLLRPHYESISWLAKEYLSNPKLDDSKPFLRTIGLSVEILDEWADDVFDCEFTGLQLDSLLEHYKTQIGYLPQQMAPFEDENAIGFSKSQLRFMRHDEKRRANKITSKIDSRIEELEWLVKIIYREENKALRKSNELLQANERTDIGDNAELRQSGSATA